MARIIFDMLQTTGHLNPSFRLAKLLQQRGHRVEYTASDQHEAAIRQQGFDTHVIYQLSAERLRKDNEVMQRKFPAFLRNVMRRTIGKMLAKYLKNVTLFTMEREAMMGRIKRVLSLQPDLIIVDSMAPLHRAILYYAYDVPVVLLQTMMSPSQTSQTPPLHSKLVPKDTRWYAVRLQWYWHRYYALRYLKKRWRKLIYFGNDPHTLSELIMKKCGLPKDQLDYQRTINTGIKGLIEVSLGPRALDFPRCYPDYEVAAGYAVDTERIEPPMTDEVARILNNCNRPLIYCSLGTISTVHNVRSVQLWRKIIRAVGDQPWEVLCAVGAKIDIEALGTIPDNVHVFDRLPQLAVLARADLMITHGGLNSVVECILHEVPMIVCPLNNHWDQNGNAARVVYHGLGLRSRLRWERTSIVTGKINQVFQAAAFRENVVRMKSKIIQGDQHSQIADMIDQMLAEGQRLVA